MHHSISRPPLAHSRLERDDAANASDKENALQHRPVGRIGLDVSAINFGCWEMGGSYGSCDDTQVVNAIQCAVVLSVNGVDNA